MAVSPLTSCFYCGWDRVSKDRLGILVLYPDCVSLSSITQPCPTFCDPMDYSTSGFPVHHQHPKLTQTHVHRVGDAIQLSHPLSAPSPFAFSRSQRQGLFQCQLFASGGQRIGASASASVLPVTIQG